MHRPTLDRNPSYVAAVATAHTNRKHSISLCAHTISNCGWRRRRPSTLNSQPSTKRGTTLTEVLMSLMVMGLGIVTLASLFPISIMRSVQATQLTQAAILRYNAGARIDALPQLLQPADQWRAIDPQTGDPMEHQLGDWVYDHRDPRRIYRCIQAGTSDPVDTALDSEGNPDNITPLFTWPTHTGQWIEEPNSDPPVRWQAFEARFVVDPLGYYEMVEVDNTLTRYFGNRNENPQQLLRRYNGRVTGTNIVQAKERARRMVSQPDSFEEGYVGEPVALDFASNTLQLPQEVDLSDLQSILQSNAAGTTNIEIRAILYDAFARQSQTRRITTVDNTAKIITWAEALPGGPAGPYSNISEVRLQTRDLRYSWMLSVRKSVDGGSNVNVVVFFGRSGHPNDEWVYQTPPFANLPTVIQNELQNAPNSNRADNFRAFDKRPPNFPKRVFLDTTGSPSPFLKKGGFVLDPENAHWYRIENYIEHTGNVVELHIDRPARANSNSVILMPGIIEVFPIEGR
jgi:hypothetical protein